MIGDRKLDAGLEMHFENLLEHAPELRRIYKNKLLEFAKNLNRLECFEIIEGEGFCRVKFPDENEKLLYFFSFGDISPITETRFVRVITGSVLRKEVVYIPSYSFTIDTFATSVYWGEKQAILDPEFWKRYKLTSLVLEIPSRTMEYSSANIIWPRSIERYFPTNSLHLTQNFIQAYLFNALTLPRFDTSGCFLPSNTSSFIIIGDTSVKLISIHKTIFTVLQTQGKSPLSKICLLTDAFKSKIINCELHFPEALKESGLFRSGLLVASLYVGKDGLKKPFFYMYPLKVPMLGEEYGVTLTLLSTMLRSLYLRSKNSIEIDTTLKDLTDMLMSIFSRIMKKGDSELGMRIVEDEKGISTLIKALGIYCQDDEKIMYLHPYLIEMLAQMYNGIDKVPSNIIPKEIVMKVSECLEALEKDNVDMRFKLNMVEWLCSLGFDNPWSIMKDFVTSSAWLARASFLTKLIYAGEFS